MNKAFASAFGLSSSRVFPSSLYPPWGQNIQLHYDLGRYLYPKVQADRPRMTMTVEQQSLDRFGDTFYFVDMSFLQQGAVSANWKFMRNLRFWQGPLSWHVRYDGGLRFINANAPEPVGSRAISLNDAFMTGVTYTYLSPERRTMLSLTPLLQVYTWDCPASQL